MSIDFSTGSYNASTKVFTSANGVQYYVSADNCASNSLNQVCNTQYCSWGEWKEDADGKASCTQPCSSYVYKQYSTCPNGKCNAEKSLSRTQYLSCGPNQCASKGLSEYGACSASCGGGTQMRTCNISPIAVSSNLPQGYSLGNPAYSQSAYVEKTATKSAFSDRSSRHNYANQLYSWFAPHDLPDERF
jgi:hypothetical protein